MRTRITALVLVLWVLVFAVPAQAQGLEGVAGRSPIASLRLDPACPMHPDAWGRIVYTRSGPVLAFVLNAHNLPTEGEYHLYTNGVLLASGAANPSGNLRLFGVVPGSVALEGGRFELIHHHEGHMGDGDHLCVILVSAPHGYEYTP